MAGPANSGKSFIQNHLITPSLGGRVAEPHMFMSGGTKFSDSLPAAEHWKIEDQGNPTPKGRKAIEISLKQATANEGVTTHHPKGKALKSVQAFRRLSISCNDDPESLRILPKMNNSLRDKMPIRAAAKGGIPEDHGDPEKQKAYRAKIYAELPGFLHYLQRSLIIDPKYKGRFGVADYHDPEIMRKLNALLPAHQVRDLIDEEFEGRDDCVEGTAREIFVLFTKVAKQINTLCKGSPSVFGKHLSDLVRECPDRFKSRLLDGRTIYTITFP